MADRKRSLCPLQHALNMASRLVFKARRLCHVSSLVEELKLFAVDKRIEAKILLLAFGARGVPLDL